MALASAGRILGPDKNFLSDQGRIPYPDKKVWVASHSKVQSTDQSIDTYTYPVYTFLNFFPLPKPSNNILCQCKEITDIIEDDDLRTEDLSWKEDEWISSGCIWRDIPQLDCDPD